MKPFTEREDELLRKYHDLGASIRYQADQLNRPYGSICSRRNTLGLKYFYKGQYNKAKYTEVEYSEVDTTKPAGNPELPSGNSSLFMDAVTALVAWGLVIAGTVGLGVLLL